MRALINRIRQIQVPAWKLFLLAGAACGAVFLCLLVYLTFCQPAPAPTPTPQATAAPVLVTAGQMAQLSYNDSVLGPLSWELDEAALAELNRVLVEYDITTPEEICQFLAQVTVETGAGRALTEQGDEAYFQRNGYTTGTRGAGYLQLTHAYGQMAFSTWMMKKYVPQLASISFKSPAEYGQEAIAQAYYDALQLAANLGLDVSRYSRIVYAADSPVPTGADYIAQNFAWESAGYYWQIAGIGQALSQQPGDANVEVASGLVGGGNLQSRREAYAAFYPVLSGQSP